MHTDCRGRRRRQRRPLRGPPCLDDRPTGRGHALFVHGPSRRGGGDGLAPAAGVGPVAGARGNCPEAMAAVRRGSAKGMRIAGCTGLEWVGAGADGAARNPAAEPPTVTATAMPMPWRAGGRRPRRSPAGPGWGRSSAMQPTLRPLMQWPRPPTAAGCDGAAVLAEPMLSTADRWSGGGRPIACPPPLGRRFSWLGSAAAGLHHGLTQCGGATVRGRRGRPRRRRRPEIRRLPMPFADPPTVMRPAVRSE
jgi:hypothetical protein